MDLSGKPSTSHSLGVHFKYRPELWNEWSPSFVFNTWQIRGEYRHYWRTFVFDDTLYIDNGSLIARHYNECDTTINPIISYISHIQRRYLNGIVKRNPRDWRAYYIGIYGEADRFTYLFQSNGHQGKGFGAGVTAGYTMPVYPFATGASIDLDLGVSVGARMEEYDEFEYIDETHCYHYTGHSDRHLVPYPVLADAHVSFVYRFGSISRKVLGRHQRFVQNEIKAAEKMRERGNMQTKRYQDRAQRRDSIANARKAKHQRDSVARVHRMDSISNARRAQFVADSLRRDSIDRAKADAKEQRRKAKHEQNADSTAVAPTDSVVTIPFSPISPTEPTTPTIPQEAEPMEKMEDTGPPEPGTPDELDNPETPETLETPDTPEDEPAPNTPDVPEELEEQDSPAEPEESPAQETSEETDNTDEQSAPDEEPAPDTPAEPEEAPAAPEQPETPEEQETPTEPGEETDE